jgi:3-methyladenine DNA glycosylase/8-oxoguanine DNA glycosylase
MTIAPPRSGLPALAGSAAAAGPETPVRTTWAPAEKVDLRLVLSQLGRGTGDPTFRWDREGRFGPPGAWRTLLTPHGAATLHLAQQRGGGIAARAWGPGAEWAIAGVPELLGAGDDRDGFDPSAHPLVKDAAHRLPGLRLARVGLVVEMLLAAVIEQKVTTLEAHAGWRVLVRKHGGEAPGPAPEGMRVFPSPEMWRRIPSWEWHRAGIGPQRAATCQEVVRVAPGLERTLSLGRGGDEVRKRLRTVRGVGVWTAAEAAQRAHGDPDAVSVGDFHIHDIVGWALAGTPVDDDGMLELLEPWRGHRQRVVRLILASGFRKPRFGPKLTIQDHRGH